MNFQDDDPLLKDVLDTDSDALRRNSLDRTLAALRRRRQFVRVQRIAVVGCFFAMGAVALLMLNRNSPDPVAKMEAPPRLVDHEATPIVDVISDEELFALFPDRPVALIGKPGQQKLVFLDASPGRGSDRL
jgi:hypothetical protein